MAVATEAVAQLDSQGQISGFLACDPRRGWEHASDAALADAAVHGAAASRIALPLQPHREVADAQ